MGTAIYKQLEQRLSELGLVEMQQRVSLRKFYSTFCKFRSLPVFLDVATTTGTATSGKPFNTAKTMIPVQFHSNDPGATYRMNSVIHSSLASKIHPRGFYISCTNQLQTALNNKVNNCT